MHADRNDLTTIDDATLLAWLKAESEEAAKTDSAEHRADELFDVVGLAFELLRRQGSAAIYAAADRWVAKQRSRGRKITLPFVSRYIAHAFSRHGDT